ncbi:hypothetical protein EON67_05845 [archaeon]|nr:MAG: hypothetical protein EON67_05845 [archaeon]
MMSVLSVSILVLKRVQQGNLNGISLKTLQAFAAVRGARLVSILVRPHRACAPKRVGTHVSLPTRASCPACLHSFLQLHEGYLPFDKSGDWFYQLCEVLVLLLVGVLLAFAFTYVRLHTLRIRRRAV